MPHNNMRKFETGKASLGSNCSIPNNTDEYIVPPPMPHAVDNELLINNITNSNNSKG